MKIYFYLCEKQFDTFEIYGIFFGKPTLYINIQRLRTHTRLAHSTIFKLHWKTIFLTLLERRFINSVILWFHGEIKTIWMVYVMAVNVYVGNLQCQSTELTYVLARSLGNYRRRTHNLKINPVPIILY